MIPHPGVVSGACFLVDNLHTSCFRTVSFKMDLYHKRGFLLCDKFQILDFFSPESFFFIMALNCFLITQHPEVWQTVGICTRSGAVAHFFYRRKLERIWFAGSEKKRSL